MSNFAQYVFFAIVLFALGRIVQVLSSDVDDEGDEDEDEDETSSFEEIVDEEADEADIQDLEQNDAE